MTECGTNQPNEKVLAPEDAVSFYKFVIHVSLTITMPEVLKLKTFSNFILDRLTSYRPFIMTVVLCLVNSIV